jgi:citrate lyase subunit beta/citryl-CoA lyase
MMRSLLFVPADSERKLDRSRQSGADALILDLEDSVIPAHRPAARHQARTFLASSGSAGFRRYVRINPLASGVALADLVAVVPERPDGILLPKCLPEDVHTLDRYLSALEAASGLVPGSIRVIAIATETPAAMLALVNHAHGGYAGGSPRLEGITWVPRIWRRPLAVTTVGRTGSMTMSI